MKCECNECFRWMDGWITSLCLMKNRIQVKQTQKKQAKQKSNVTINYLSGHNDYHDDHDDHGDDDDHDKPTNKSKNCQRFNYIMFLKSFDSLSNISFKIESDDDPNQVF
ncbi:hypothetical protein DERP_010680 [Dermatophagoides pteronyssinus]|uniref:Uncharacterized protein n=1 Tax=Dermatophagoides pteronyssinus TaxID=6956 RepID=A0ABQ8JA34_DERPT|nr:hypothetical protein DERP_010680 [Dermatophagoides pteronyssinus]